MKKFLLFLVVVISSFGTGVAFAVDTRVDMGISPIRDEFTVEPGTTTKRTIKFYNNGGLPLLIYVTTEDCIQGEGYGTPRCRSFTGTGGSIDPDNASTWIQVDGSDRFTVPAKSEKVVTYTITVPQNATPGGHYGAIFFNNPGQGSNGNAVNMVRRIGMLYLMKVPGDIVVKTDLGDILIDMPFLDSAPDIWDRLKKNIRDRSAWSDIVTELNPFWEKPIIKKTDLQISLSIPIQNQGNIHIKPTGKIYIYDGEELLKKVGKESIVDENGVFKGEKVVDYLPINDEGGNVLPDSDRVFRVDWLGFATQEVSETGENIIRFESPSDYFSRQSGSDVQMLYPWEKLALRHAVKKLTAKVEFSYKNPETGKDEIFTREIPLDIAYNYIEKTLNTGVFIVIVILIISLILIRRRDVHIEELEDELDDEIAALEKAQKLLLKKKSSRTVPVKTISSAKKTGVKTSVKKNPSTKKDTVTEVTKKKTSPKKVEESLVPEKKTIIPKKEKSSDKLADVTLPKPKRVSTPRTTKKPTQNVPPGNSAES